MQKTIAEYTQSKCLQGLTDCCDMAWRVLSTTNIVGVCSVVDSNLNVLGVVLCGVITVDFIEQNLSTTQY